MWWVVIFAAHIKALEKMFTGIIEGMGRVLAIRPMGSGLEFELSCGFVGQLRVEESLAHNGCCLTVAGLDLAAETYTVVAVEETLRKTNLGTWRVGTLVNLERSMPASGRFDGHIVQGHVDATATLSKIEDRNGSWLLTYTLGQLLDGACNGAQLLVEKGSICINGTSLTCFGITDTSFQVTIIPYSWEQTNIHSLAEGDTVNIEFDIVAKYLWKWQGPKA